MLKPAISRKRARQADRRISVFAAPAAEVEEAVDGALELECRLTPLLVVLGDLAQPRAAHLHVGHLVGEHPVLAEAQHRVAHLVGEVAHRREDVDGEAFEGAVDTGETEHRIGVASGLEQRDGLAEYSPISVPMWSPSLRQIST